MERRFLATLGVLTVVAGFAVAAYVSEGPVRTTLSRSPDAADHVTLYENGLAAVALRRSFDSTGATQVIRYALPTTTVFESIRLEGEGVQVKETRSSLSDRPFAQPGDDVVLHIDGGATFTGVLLSLEDGTFLVDQGEGHGTAVVAAGQVKAIEVKGRTVRPEGPGTTNVDFVVDSAAGNHTVKLSYLAQGPGWTPSYQLDVGTGRITFFATVTGVADWSDVGLDIVAGSPRVVAQARFQAASLSFDRITLGGAGGAGNAGDGYSDAFEPSTALGDLHKYHYPARMSFQRGETVRLAVLTGSVEVQRHYYRLEGAGGMERVQAFETYQVRNTLSEPLASGVVRMYLGDEWVGADTMQDVGRGESTNVTSASSGEVKGEVVTVEHHSTGYGSGSSEDWTYRFTVKNHRQGDGASIDVHAEFRLDYYQTVTLDRHPDAVTDQKAVWDFQLPGGGASQSFTVHYRQTR